MKARDDVVFLSDIFEASKKIQEDLEGVDFLDFIINPKKQDIVLWNFQVIGEAAKQLSEKVVRQ